MNSLTTNHLLESQICHFEIVQNTQIYSSVIHKINFDIFMKSSIGEDVAIRMDDCNSAHYHQQLCNVDDH